MARDTELDRLRTEQDLAFRCKRDAWQALEEAWQQRCSAEKSLNQAYYDKQDAYAKQETSWQEYQHICQRNRPRIDRLNVKVSARTYAKKGRRHKARAQKPVVKRQRLVDEIHAAKAWHEATVLAFQHMKDRFNQAKADHEQALADFRQAKAKFEEARAAFCERREVVLAESKPKRRHKNDRRTLAEKAGVPDQYQDNVWISRGSNGIINLYFGGIGKPNGPGHGHYVMDRNENVTYRRDPVDPQNSTEPLRLLSNGSAKQ